jgi:uncharacterized membrane protein
VIERKLATWLGAGLIDAETAARLRAYEAEHTRPLALWAVIGIGTLAIALGLVSVVAANWDTVPPELRLGLHFALITLALAALWRWPRQGWEQEALLFICGALGLTFFGHLGQAYQTSSPLWHPLAAWLGLFGPLFLLRGQSWLAALAVTAALVAAGWGFAADHDYRDAVLAVELPTALPLALVPLGAMARPGARGGFWRRLEQLGFGYALGGASVAIVITNIDRQTVRGEHGAIWLLTALAAAAALLLARRDRSGQAAAGVMAAAGILTWLALQLGEGRVGFAVLFMLLWAAVAVGALHGAWRATFQLAVAMLALRLIVLSFQFDDNLLTSGFGLIGAGVMILAIAYAALRIARTYAPAREAAA